MLEDFFIRALIAGVGVALIAAPFGCFIVWRKMAFFGDTIAHAALLGIALAFFFDLNPVSGVFGVAFCVAVILTFTSKFRGVSGDTMLAILAHSTLAGGLVLLSLIGWVRIDLMSFLFGDVLTIGVSDIAMIYFGGVIVLLILMRIWRVLLADTISSDIARAEGFNPTKVWFVFMLSLAWLIAIAIKIIGVLLISSLLIIPAATSRPFAKAPIQMALIAGGVGALAVILGLFGSLWFDTPSGPSIVLAASGLFFCSLVIARITGGNA